MSELDGRLRKLRRRLDKLDLTALYVGAASNVRYLTGFTGSAGHLLVTADALTLFTDGRYRTQAHQETDGVEIVAEPRDSMGLLLEALDDRRVRELGYERNRLSLTAFERLRGSKRRRKLVALDGFVEEQRQIKSEREIDRIRRSAELASDAFEDWCGKLRPTWTERRAAAELEYLMRRRGAEGAAFETIVASGPHTALAHARPRDVRVGRKSLILIDHGAILGGYSSDMTRVVSFGDPGLEMRRIHEAVREAEQAALEAVRAGRKASTIDRAARKALKTSGLAESFSHSTGHGVGLEVHEPPVLGPKREQRLKEGMVVTIEPGVYVEGLGGVRIEDMVVVRKNGCERLTLGDRGLRLL